MVRRITKILWLQDSHKCKMEDNLVYWLLNLLDNNHNMYRANINENIF